MRVAIGLMAILITVGVIVWIMSAVTLPSMQQAAAVQKKVKPQVQQIAGQDTDGQDARNTISLDAETSGGGGKMNSVVVTAIDANGAMARYFGLQRGDSIVEIAPQNGAMMPVKEMGTASEAKDQLLSAYQNSQQIVVIRSGQRLTLPLPPPAKPGQPAPAAPAPGTGLQQQLDALKNVPTH